MEASISVTPGGNRVSVKHHPDIVLSPVMVTMDSLTMWLTFEQAREISSSISAFLDDTDGQERVEE